MGVHTRAIVAENGFGHKRCGLVVLVSYISHNVFVNHDLISHGDKLVIFKIDFCLTGRAHFMMLAFDIKTTANHRSHHLVTNVHQMIGGRYREITTLMSNFVPQIR